MVDVTSHGVSFALLQGQLLAGEIPLDDFRNVLEVNLIAPYVLIKNLLPAMVEHGGSIINVTSDAGRVGYPGWGAYGISKFGIEGMSQTWAAELKESGVRVNCVDPGDMNTAMHRAAEPDEDPLPGSSYILHRTRRARLRGRGSKLRRRIGVVRRRSVEPRTPNEVMVRVMSGPFSFALPPELQAKEPHERREVARDHVRLMVIERTMGQLTHTRFDHIGEFLRKDDLLVFNTSRTLPASLRGCGAQGGPCIEVRLAEHRPDDSWLALLLCQ